MTNHASACNRIKALEMAMSHKRATYFLQRSITCDEPVAVFLPSALLVMLNRLDISSCTPWLVNWLHIFPRSLDSRCVSFTTREITFTSSFARHLKQLAGAFNTKLIGCFANRKNE